MKLAVAQPGDGGPQFAPEGRRDSVLSSRDGGQQVWLADFDPATGATSNAKKLTAIATEADNAQWSPDGRSIVFTSAVYPDCPAITTADFATGNKCNADRDAAARRQQGEGADLHPPALPPLEPLHRRQALASLSRLGRERRNARPDAQRPARRSAVFARRRRRLCAFRPTRRNWPSLRISIPSRPPASAPRSSPST